MNLLGITLKTPTFNEVTAASIFGVGLWLACLGCLSVAGQVLTRQEAGAALLVFVWGAIGVRLGIHVGKGGRHLLANVLVSGALLGAYEAAWAFAN